MNYICKITRPDVDENALFGFVLKKSNFLTLVAEEDDFILDGYKVLRNCDIDICKPTLTTRHCTRIMKKEGLLESINCTPDIDLTNWATLLLSLKRQDKYVIVEDEVEDTVSHWPYTQSQQEICDHRLFRWQWKMAGPDKHCL